VLLLVRDEFGNLKGLREDKHIRLAVRCPVCAFGFSASSGRAAERQVSRPVGKRGACGLTGGARVQCVLEGRSGARSVAHVVEAPSAEDGMYTFVYRPDEAGPARLSITVDAEHVRGSPFTIQVRWGKGKGVRVAAWVVGHGRAVTK
jgi:hypothetical protein